LGPSGGWAESGTTAPRFSRTETDFDFGGWFIHTSPEMIKNIGKIAIFGSLNLK
jgi:hypothetical protein